MIGPAIGPLPRIGRRTPAVARAHRLYARLLRLLASPQAPARIANRVSMSIVLRLDTMSPEELAAYYQGLPALRRMDNRTPPALPSPEERATMNQKSRKPQKPTQKPAGRNPRNPGYRPPSQRPKSEVSKLGAAKAKGTTKAKAPAKAPKGVTRGRPVAVPKPKPTTTTAGDLAKSFASAPSDSPSSFAPGELRHGTFSAYPLLTDLPELVAQQRRLKARIKAVDPDIAAEKELRLEIEGLLLASGLEGTIFDADTEESIRKDDGVTVGPFTVRRVETGGQLVLSEDRLLAAGVSADTIAACRVRVGQSSYVTVRETKRRKGQGDVEEADEAIEVSQARA